MKTPLNQKLEDGFALPIAIGVGVVMILIATTMVIRSTQSQVASISQKSNHKSLAAAETGVAKYQDLFNQYRGFISANMSDWDSRRSELENRQNNSCSTPTPDPNYRSSDVATFFDPPPSLNNPWIDIDSSDSEKGRFRLIDYQVNANLNRGSLTIEGADGRNPDDSTTALTRLEVDFPLDGISVAQTPPGSSNPGCALAAMNLPTTTSLNDFIPQGTNDELNIINVSMSDEISSTVGSDITFPRPGDPDVENYTYVLNSDPAINLSAGDTLTIQQDKKVFLVTEGDIDINGGQIDIRDGAQLFIISAGNITLTQWGGDPLDPSADPPADRPVVFSQETSQPAAAEAFQVFMTGIDANPSTAGDSQGELVINVDQMSYATTPPPTPPAVNFTNLSFVAYAPDGSVTLNKLSNSQTRLRGAVWAKNFALSADPPVFASTGVNPPDLPVFWKARLDTSQISKRLSSINSWKKTDRP